MVHRGGPEGWAALPGRGVGGGGEGREGARSLARGTKDGGEPAGASGRRVRRLGLERGPPSGLDEAREGERGL